MVHPRRDLMAGFNFDLRRTGAGFTQISLGSRLGKSLRFDRVGWLRPELAGEVGVTYIRNIGSSEGTIASGQRESATLPYVGLRIGAAIDVLPGTSLGIWLSGRHTLIEESRTVYLQPTCEQTGCSAEEWQVGGHSLGLQVGFQRDIAW